MAYLVRYELALLAFFGFFNVYAMRVNLSVAIVSMKDQYHWTKPEQGLILGAFFYGYILTQVLGGYLATRFGGKWVFGVGVLVTALLTILTPLVAHNLPLFVAVRILEGIGEGVTFPAMHGVWARWSPPLERSKLTTMSYSGAYVGTIVSMPLSGWLCASEYGWQSVFYLCGGLGVVWFVLWIALVHSDPRTHGRISEEERSYIVDSIENEAVGAEGSEQEALLPQGERPETTTPWGAIFSSTAVWAIICGHFCNNWGFYNLLTCLPSYLANVLNLDIKHAGFLASLPYLCLFLVANVWSQIADALRKRGDCGSTAFWRKLSQSIAHLTAAAALVACGYGPAGKAGQTYAVTCLCVAVGAVGFANSGFNVNHLDIAPKYAGVLMGITNTVATIPGFAAPQLTDMIATADFNHTSTNATLAHESREKLQLQWREVFFIAAGVYLFGVVCFALGASGTKQPWADGKVVAKRGVARVN